jgi:hypothetical protein
MTDVQTAEAPTQTARSGPDQRTRMGLSCPLSRMLAARRSSASWPERWICPSMPHSFSRKVAST